MHRFLVCWLAALTMHLPAVSAQSLRYLGEVGHLSPPFSDRGSITLGRVLVTSEADGGLVITGRDDDRKIWKAAVPVGSGIGFTDVWQADFDQNGRQDLLIAAYFPQNGRCTDEITLAFLLFDNHGRPVPWVIQTRIPSDNKEPATPTIFADPAHNGRLQLVATDCSYSAPRVGADRTITGIYTAENARWKLVRPADMAPYTALVLSNHRFQPGSDEFVPTDPTHWPDLGNTMDPHGPPPTKVKAVLAPSPDCRGIHIPILDGRVVVPATDPCEVIGKNRLELSDGVVCFGWPVVVIDGRNGREIVADPERLQPALQRIANDQLSVVFTGQSEAERCTPTIAWAAPQ